MKIAIISVLIIIAFIVLYFVIRIRRGHLIAKHLHLFEITYDDVLQTTGSRNIALKSSLQTFKSCPVLNQLSDNELNKFATVVGSAPDPKRLVHKIIMILDSKKALQAFRDERFLNDLISSYKEE